MHTWSRRYWYVANKDYHWNSAQQGQGPRGSCKGWHRRKAACRWQEVVLKKTMPWVSSKPFSISFLGPKKNDEANEEISTPKDCDGDGDDGDGDGDDDDDDDDDGDDDDDDASMYRDRPNMWKHCQHQLWFVSPILAQVSLSFKLCRLCLFQKTTRGSFYGPKQPSKDQTFFLVGVCAYHPTSQTLVKGPTVSC